MAGENRADNAARGRIVLDASGVVQAQRTVSSAAQSMERSLAAIDDRLKRLERSANTVGDVLGTAFALRVAQAGVSAATRLTRINTLMVTFSRSTDLANQRLEELRRIADRTGQGFLDVAEGALAILPAVGRANVDLGKTLSLVQRLALLDPAQGVQGAAFAVRELLSGQSRSLAGRFELPQNQLRAIVDQAGGDPQKIIDGLDRLVDGLGLTQEAFEGIGQSGAFAFQRLGSTIQELIGTAFTPFTNNILLPLTDNFATFVGELNQTAPALLEIAPAVAIAIAALGPLGRLLEGTKERLRELRSFATSPLGSRLLVGGGALAAGTGIGLFAAQGLARVGVGDQRLLTEDSGKVIQERFSQAIVVVVGALLGVGEKISETSAKVIVRIANAFASVGLFIEEAGLRFAAVFSDLAARFNDIFDPATAAAFREAARIATQRADQLSADRVNLNDPTRLALVDATIEEGIRASYDRVREGVLVPLSQFLGLIPSAAESAEAAVEATEGTSGLFQEIADVMPAVQQALREALPEFRELAEEFEREGADIDYDRNLQDARRAEDEFIASSRQQRDLQRALAQQDNDYRLQRAEQIADFNASQLALESDHLQQRSELIEDYNRKSADAYDAYARELQEIADETAQNVSKAASRLDATGVFNAQETGARRTSQASQNFSREAAERQRDLQLRLRELQTNFEQERAQRAENFTQLLADQEAQFNENRQRQLEALALQRQDEQEDRELRRRREQEDRARENFERQQEYNRRLFELRRQIAEQSGLSSAIQSTVSTTLNTAYSTFLTFVNNVRAATQSLANASPIQRPAAPSTGPYVPIRGGRTVPTFAAGGLAMPGFAWVGENGPELVQFNQPARVYNAAESRGMAGSITIENLSQSFGDIGSYSPGQINEMFVTALENFLGQAQARILGGR